MKVSIKYSKVQRLVVSPVKQVELDGSSSSGGEKA
jgi:hypothetical protein